MARVRAGPGRPESLIRSSVSLFSGVSARNQMAQRALSARVRTVGSGSFKASGDGGVAAEPAEEAQRQHRGPTGLGLAGLEQAGQGPLVVSRGDVPAKGLDILVAEEGFVVIDEQRPGVGLQHAAGSDRGGGERGQGGGGGERQVGGRGPVPGEQGQGRSSAREPGAREGDSGTPVEADRVGRPARCRWSKHGKGLQRGHPPDRSVSLAEDRSDARARGREPRFSVEAQDQSSNPGRPGFQNYSRVIRQARGHRVSAADATLGNFFRRVRGFRRRVRATIAVF